MEKNMPDYALYAVRQPSDFEKYIFATIALRKIKAKNKFYPLPPK